MWFGIVTIFPEMFSGFLQSGMIHQAQKKQLLTCHLTNPRLFASDKHRTVDDRPYGGGPGMVMMAEPLARAIDYTKQQSPYQNAPVIYASPEGEKLTDHLARDLAQKSSLVLLAGRYEGVDQRLINQHVDHVVSIGDYVLTGGELALMVMIDAISRFIPGVLGDALSYQQDAFSIENDGLLDCPHYTRPFDYNGEQVPDVLLSGNHQAIARWRRKQKLGRTWLKRPDLLALEHKSDEDLQLLKEFQTE